MARTRIDLTETGERSTVEIVRAVADDVTMLFRKEVQLVREEVVGAVTSRLRAAGALAAAGILALFAIAFAGFAATAGLANVMATWAAASIVAGTFLALAAVAVMLGRGRKPPLVPEETVRTIKEDVEWTKERLKR
jgi:hypothetical protein